MNLTLGQRLALRRDRSSRRRTAPRRLQTQNLTRFPPGSGQRSVASKCAEGQKVIAAFARDRRDAYKELTIARQCRPASRRMSTNGRGRCSCLSAVAASWRSSVPLTAPKVCVVDHYSPAAGRTSSSGKSPLPEIKACGPNPPYAVFCDSLEVGGENWTPNLLAEFKKRRGYDLEPLLPALFDDVGPEDDGNPPRLGPDSDGTFQRLLQPAHQKTGQRQRTPGSASRLTARRRPRFTVTPSCDLPEGEQYTEWKSFSDHALERLRPVHLLGAAGDLLGNVHLAALGRCFARRRWTSRRRPICTFCAASIRSSATAGLTRRKARRIPAGAFTRRACFDEKNPWWIVMPDVTKYLQRVSYILRQGTPGQRRRAVTCRTATRGQASGAASA